MYRYNKDDVPGFEASSAVDDGPFDVSVVDAVAKSQYSPADYAKLEVLLKPFNSLTKDELTQLLEINMLPPLVGSFSNVRKKEPAAPKRDRRPISSFEQAAVGLNSVRGNYDNREVYVMLDTLLPGTGAQRVHNALTHLNIGPDTHISSVDKNALISELRSQGVPGSNINDYLFTNYPY